MNICNYIECDNQTKTKYCSLSCSAKEQYRVNPKPKKNRIKLCERDDCDNLFDSTKDRKKRFCSRSCSATINNYARGIKERRCLFCNGSLYTGLKYCSREHGAAYRNKVFIESWLTGEINPQSEYDIPTRIRRYLLEQSGYKCSSPACCVPDGWGEINPKSGKTPLTVDHIDGDATNNTVDNLRILCPNCHSLTPTYGGLNRGNGRSYRYRQQAESVL